MIHSNKQTKLKATELGEVIIHLCARLTASYHVSTGGTAFSSVAKKCHLLSLFSINKMTALTIYLFPFNLFQPELFGYICNKVV